MLVVILVFIFILGLLIFVHEFGHFLTAKKAGVKVEEFGFGFPPRLFGVKRGETTYSLNLIPLGGFVKIKGETGEYPDDPDSFSHKKPWKRAIILSSGVLMNFLLAIALFSIGFGIGLPQAIEGDLPHAKVQDLKIQVVGVFQNTPAAAAGLQSGDVIVTVDQKKFERIEELQQYTTAKQGESLFITFERNKVEKTANVAPQLIADIGKVGLGVALVKTGIVSYPWYYAIWEGTKLTFLLTKEIIVAIFELLKNLIVAQKAGIEVTGPVGIAVITAQAVKLGFVYLLHFTALLSVNLAIINFLPIPALDGGRILFLIAEKVRRHPINRRWEAMAHNLGFALLILLVLFVTYRDIIKFGDKFLQLWARIIQ